MPQVSQITDSDFKDKVKGSSGFVLLDFWADWCVPCKQLLPILEEIAKDFNDLQIVKMNIDDNPETPTKFNVRSIPTLLLFEDGEHIATKVGGLPKKALLEWLGANGVK